MQKQKRTGRIVAFTGFKGSGKSTAASALEQHGFVRWSFADPMRAMLIPLLQSFGHSHYDAEKLLTTPELKEIPIDGPGLIPRRLMQTLGTEWGRSCVSQNLWIEAMRRGLGGQIIFIQRQTSVGGDDWHRSECGVVLREGDKMIVNDGSKADLSAKVLAFGGY